MLVHQDAEIADPDFCKKVRRALDDPEVGVVGCVGAIGVRSIAWWEGSVTWASFIHRYGEHGGGDLPAFSWKADELPPYARTGEVDTVDGFVLALSPWAVRNIRFDESLGQLHGYDFDFCLQVRAAGRKVVTADFQRRPPPLARARQRPRHLDRGPHAGRREVGGAHAARRRRPAATGSSARGEPRRRRRPRARRPSPRSFSPTPGSCELQRALDVTTQSVSWRLTAPLRRVNALAHGRSVSGCGPSRPGRGGSPPSRPPAVRSRCRGACECRERRSATETALDSSSRRSVAS